MLIATIPDTFLLFTYENNMGSWSNMAGTNWDLDDIEEPPHWREQAWGPDFEFVHTPAPVRSHARDYATRRL